ncbi:hypothetical protein HOF92_01960 [bacterium]|nr:hypothetical protein [bacterium]
MFFFQLVSFVFSFFIGSLYADHHLSFDGLLNNSSASTEREPARIHEDHSLEGALVEQARLVPTGSFNDADRKFLFLKLYPDTVKTYLIREKKKNGTTQYRDWVENHVGNREGVMGYASDGEKKYRLFYDEEFVRDPSRDVAFLTSMVSGFMFSNDDFPFLSGTIQKKIESGEISKILSKKKGKWNVSLPRPKVNAYVLISNVDGKLKPMVVSGKNVELILEAWVDQALETGFLQYLGFDQSPELFTTNDRWRQLSQKLGWISTEMSAILMGSQRILKDYLKDEDDQQGPFLEIESPWVGSDRYRFTKTLKDKLDSYLNFFKGSDPQVLVGRVFGEEEFKNSLARAVDALEKSKNWLFPGRWKDQKPTQKILSGIQSLDRILSELKKVADAKGNSHAKILSDHLGEHGAVLFE